MEYVTYAGIFINYKGFVKLVSRYDKEEKKNLRVVQSPPGKWGMRTATLLDFNPDTAIHKIDISPFSIERLERDKHISFNPLISWAGTKRYNINHKEKQQC